MSHRVTSRRWAVLSLVVGLVLWSIAPPAAAKKGVEGWESVGFEGNYMWYEATVGSMTEADLSLLYVQAYDGDFKLGKRTTRTAEVLVAQASGGDCIADYGSYGTETGYVLLARHVVGAGVDTGAVTFDDSGRAGSLDASLTLTGTEQVWEAAYFGPQHCEGIEILAEQPLAYELDVTLTWFSEPTVVLVQRGKKGKITEKVRWVTTIESATGALDGTALSLPFGSPDEDDHWAQSLPLSSGPALIPTGTFD